MPPTTGTESLQPTAQTRCTIRSVAQGGSGWSTLLSLVKLAHFPAAGLDPADPQRP